MYDTPIMTPVLELKEGDKLDLEGDVWASYLNPVNHSLAEIRDHETDLMHFECELVEVDSIERETEDCVVVHTSYISFGVPVDHRVKRMV